MMDNCCAPQWTDFTCSPQVPSDSYFEIEHAVHEPRFLFCKKEDAEEIVKKESNAETNFDDSLEPVEATSANVAYFIPHDNKNLQEDAKNNVSEAAIKPVKLVEKSNKIVHAWNISIDGLNSAFKSPHAINLPKMAVPERIKKKIQRSQAKVTVNSKSLKNSQTSNEVKGKENTKAALNIDENESFAVAECSKFTKNNTSERRLSFKVVQRRKSNVFKSSRSSLGKSQPRVLTCQYRRKSLMKYRRNSNQFISFAEAVSKFQNGTPQRFRTMSNKDMKLCHAMKLKHAPLKLTYPQSPALRCKQRARHTNVLTQEEREIQELEEMKKHQIKANPVPVNILRGPAALKKVTKKPITIPEEFHLTQSKKTRHTLATQSSLQQISEEKEQNRKPAAPITRSRSASNMNQNNENTEQLSDNNSKTDTNTLPYTFETRNKEFQKKKEEKLKNLQVQINKAKADFHARPAPKFSKQTNPGKKPEMKKAVTLCPFSFEERDKNLAKKKEEFVKNMQEKSNKPRTFHANRVPNFKPVIVHGTSKENVRNKEKNGSLKDLAMRQTKSCNDQENKQPNIIVQPAKEAAPNIRNNEPEKKPAKDVADAIDDKSEKAQAAAKKLTVPKVELNTDKRAKERTEFDEKIRKKEQELELKKQEEEKNRLAKEKMERAELRKKTEIKARPMPAYKPMIILKSTKVPTSPRSPASSNKAKMKREP